MKNFISNARWFDEDFGFSFTKSVFTSLKIAGYDVTQTQIAARSGFAFRIWIAKTLCPSAMSIFDWDFLKKGVEQCGFEVTHITRLWNEEYLEVERREKAHAAIKKAVDDGIPAIVWDACTPEWELITGYDDDNREYSVLSVTGKKEVMHYDRLGRREIPIMSVTIPGKPNGMTEAESAKAVLQMAINHARQREWEDRPEYQDGLNAYPTWAEAMNNVTENDWQSRYYIQTYECMRRYAAEYLSSLAGDIKELQSAAKQYKDVHNNLKAALLLRNDSSFPTSEIIHKIKQHILLAGEAEEQGIIAIEEYLKTVS